MISQIKQKGFTIVELLIVIVVIAILAALSYVGYTSITQRANNSTAAAAAKAVADTAQNYQGANSSYPISRALFISGGSDPLAKMPSDIVFTGTTGGVTSATGAAAYKTVMVEGCGTSPFTGLRITYRTGAASTDVKTVGDVTSCASPTVLS